MIRPIAVLAGILTATALAMPAAAGSGGALQIIISKEKQSLVVYDGEQIIASSRVSTGKAGHTTPSGIFSVLEKKQYHESNLYSNAPMPWMQRLTWSGIALHEGVVPNYPASHGCIRMPPAFARALYQITERGAHVIVSDREIAPFPISHATLFKPEQPAPEGQLLSDAELRPATIDGKGRATQVAMADTLPKAGATAKVVLEDLPPLRIIITRRGDQDTMADIQRLLTSLGFDAGTSDGRAGKMTIAAINGFKRWKGLPTTKTQLVTPELLDALYTSTGEGKPAVGRILVRQKFKQIVDEPVAIANPEIALGTHFIEATEVNRFSGKAEWHALTMENHLSAQTMQNFGIKTQDGAEDADAAMRALDRISIPDNIRRKIGLLLAEGASLTITDNGISHETGQGTDFITLTKRGPRV